MNCMYQMIQLVWALLYVLQFCGMDVRFAVSSCVLEEWEAGDFLLFLQDFGVIAKFIVSR
jgi:hypothetical protein